MSDNNTGGALVTRTLAELFEATNEARKASERQAEEEWAARATERTARDFSRDFPGVHADRIEECQVFSGDVTLGWVNHYGAHAWTLEGKCPKCGERTQSDPFGTAEELAGVYANFVPGFVHVCPILGDSSSPRRQAAERLAAAVIDLVDEVYGDQGE